jgi:uncharacterized membrane protein YbaN (DUF454 family)
MFLRIVLGIISSICMLLGLIGLALPLMPGFVFFGIGILCLAGAEPRLGRFMSKQPRFGLFMQRIENSSGSDFIQRCKVALAASAEVFVGRRSQK